MSVRSALYLITGGVGEGQGGQRILPLVIFALRSAMRDQILKETYYEFYETFLMRPS